MAKKNSTSGRIKKSAKTAKNDIAAHGSGDPALDYRHDAPRKNIPTAGLAAQGKVQQVPKLQYAYNPHLPPQLRFDATGTPDALPELLRIARNHALSDDEAREIAEALRNREPWLEWAGKRELPGFAVEPVALHIHERISAQAIVKVAARLDVERDLFADPELSYKEAVQFYHVGLPGMGGGFQTETQDREAYYRSVHLQTIKFEIARLVTGALIEGIENRTPKLALRGRHQLFPQVLRYVERYVAKKIDLNGCHPSELGLETYVKRIVERLLDAIEPNDAAGEPPLLPVMNRYKPIGSTGEVNFKTIRDCVQTVRSHINQVVADTGTWEQQAVFRLEAAKDVVKFYARNDHLEFSIPYEYFGISHAYIPDFLVRLSNDMTLVLEVKGQEDEQDRAKHQAAQRWVSAVNRWGTLGWWDFHVCRNPQMLGRELEIFVQAAAPESVA
jgi:hypothetical protein